MCRRELGEHVKQSRVERGFARVGRGDRKLLKQRFARLRLVKAMQSSRHARELDESDASFVLTN